MVMIAPQQRLAPAWILTVTALVGHHLWNNDAPALGMDKTTVKAEQRGSAGVTIEPALECLGLSTNIVPFNETHSVKIKYPKYPKDHFQEIQSHLSMWYLSRIEPHEGPGYHGPWIEDHWQMHFQQKAESLSNANFSSVFGPYIPLLPAWTDIWVSGNYTDELIQALRDVLRPDVIYITVSQNDDGFAGDNPQFQQLQEDYNILILSAGGYGHVPVPLLKQPETVLPKIPVDNRNHLMSYVGSRHHSPKALRFDMLSIVGYEHYYYGDDWRSIMQDSKFSLCPRGFGRTSYHVMETLQMGLIPIHVYIDGDIPWMPYASTILKNISFSTNLKELPDLMQQLEAMPDSRIEQMEQEIVGLIEEYFTFEGAMNQIEQFMLDSRNSALVCQPLPKHVGSNRPKYNKCWNI